MRRPRDSHLCLDASILRWQVQTALPVVRTGWRWPGSADLSHGAVAAQAAMLRPLELLRSRRGAPVTLQAPWAGMNSAENQGGWVAPAHTETGSTNNVNAFSFARVWPSQVHRV